MCHNITKLKKDAKDDLKWYTQKKRLQPIYIYIYIYIGSRVTQSKNVSIGVVVFSILQENQPNMLAFVFIIFTLNQLQFPANWIFVCYSILVFLLLLLLQFHFNESKSCTLVRMYCSQRVVESRDKKNCEWSLSAWKENGKKNRFVWTTTWFENGLISILARWLWSKNE